MADEFGAPTRPVFSSSGQRPPRPDSPVQGRLDGATAVVTGASGLLGAAMAQEIARRGAAVVLIGRDLEALDHTAGAAEGSPTMAGLRCDMASAEDIDAAADFVDAVGRPVDLLIHATGLSDPSTVTAAPVGLLDEHYLLNLRGPYQLTQRLLPLLADRRGRVVFFTSAGSTSHDDAHRVITDAAVKSMAEVLRSELAPTGGRVVVVATRLDAGAGEPGFLPSLARVIVDSLAADELDVAEVLAGPGPRRSQSEQR